MQAGETQPFINEILNNLTSIICDLSQPQVHVFYEAVGHIIACQSDRAAQAQLVETLMQLPNSIWAEIVDAASKVLARIVTPCLAHSVPFACRYGCTYQTDFRICLS